MEGDENPELDRAGEHDAEMTRLRTEVDDFAARLRVAGVGLVVLGVLVAAYVVAAHLV